MFTALIQNIKPSLLLVEDPRKEKVLDNFLISVDFMVVLYAKGRMEVKQNGIMTQTQRMHQI
jgi:hypothetical protein